jgi:hypothetical protein
MSKKMFLTVLFERSAKLEEEVENVVEKLKENENIEKIEYSTKFFGDTRKRNFYVERFNSILMKKYNDRVINDALENARKRICDRGNKDH